jgi:tetratricopeptide (TPR) repeat protein
MAAMLGRYWWIRGRPREGRQWLERALARAPAAPDAAVRAEALYWSGVLADEERRPAEAGVRLEESLALRRALGDERGVARTLNSLGVAARSMGELDRAEALFGESLERKRSLGDGRGVAATLSNLGLLAADRDRLTEARDRFEEALALDRESGERGTEAYSRNNLGAAQIWLGDVLAGVADVRRALRVFADLDDADGIAEAIEHLGEAALALAAPATAARFLLAAGAVRARAGAPLRDVDARRVVAALAAAEAALGSDAVAGIRAESSAFDDASAVALAAGTLLPGEEPLGTVPPAPAAPASAAGQALGDSK